MEPVALEVAAAEAREQRLAVLGRPRKPADAVPRLGRKREEVLVPVLVRVAPEQQAVLDVRGHPVERVDAAAQPSFVELGPRREVLRRRDLRAWTHGREDRLGRTCRDERVRQRPVQLGVHLGLLEPQRSAPQPVERARSGVEADRVSVLLQPEDVADRPAAGEQLLGARLRRLARRRVVVEEDEVAEAEGAQMLLVPHVVPVEHEDGTRAA